MNAAYMMNAALQNALQSQLERWQHFAPCPGTNVTIIVSDQGIWNGASGHSNVDTAEVMDRNANCYIYSITKTFTAIRILQLCEQDALSLNDPISRYLPELSHHPAINIRQLLNHTSGIPSYTDLQGYLPANLAQPSNAWSHDEVVKMTCTGELDFSPGEGWHYSNTGYMLLHRLIEAVSKRSFADNINEGIVEQIELKKTYVATGIDAGKLTPGYCPYLNDLEVMEDVTQIYHPGWCLTGLIVSTTEEIAQLYAALFNHRLINPESLKEMTRWLPCGNETHPFFNKSCYGLGLMIDPEWQYGGFYGHGGDGPGFNTWALHLPDFEGSEVTLVVFCNATMGSHPYKLTKNLLRTLANNYISTHHDNPRRKPSDIHRS
ncbi:MAG TPA: serine hydrolase domain-containing protein [Burkholderiaceae bacterium]